MNRLKNIDVVLLAGGLGSRLRPVLAGKPKVLAPLGRGTFLDYILNYLKKNGFRRIILCTGYLKHHVKRHCRNNNPGLDLFYSEENKLLGTGGALKKARPLILSETFLVMNGDTFFEIDFARFLNFHLNNNSLVTIAVARQKSPSSGNIILGNNKMIAGFFEKDERAGCGITSIGAYLMDRSVFKMMPRRQKFSLEYDLFPRLTGKKIYAFLTGRGYLDIGTPENYKIALSRLTLQSRDG